ncbi:MAG: tetratricopeptide repeat protein [Terriglobia bacterium]
MKNYLHMSAHVLLLGLVAVSVGVAQEAGKEPQKPPAQPPAAARPSGPSVEEQAAMQQIMQTSDPQQRLGLVEGYLAQFPEGVLRGQAYLAAADAYQRQGNFTKAAEYGELALEVSPRYFAAMIMVAEALSLGAVPTQPDYQEKLIKAEGYAQRALKILPDLLAATPRRPEVPEEQYKLREAYMSSLAHGTLGFIYLRRMQPAQAEKELQQATELNQLRPDPVDFQRLGFAQMRLQKYAEAEAAFQRCVELGGPSRPDCQVRLERVQKILKDQQTPKENRPPG